MAFAVIAGLVAVAALIGFGGFLALAAINITMLNLIAILVAIIITIPTIIAIQAFFDILITEGYYQIIHDGRHDSEKIKKAVFDRIIPYIIFMIILGLIYIFIFGFFTIPLFLLFQETGLIAGVILTIIVGMLIAPIMLVAQPFVILENYSGIEATIKAMQLGMKNYLFNGACMVVILIVSIILTIASLIPVLGLLISFYMGILIAIYIIEIYQENKARAR